MEGVSELNAAYVDAQYQRWKDDPHQVTRDWQWFFAGFDWNALPESPALGVPDQESMLHQLRVAELIHRYRDLGHLLACLDPLAECPTSHPLLDLATVQLSEADLDRLFYTDLPLTDTGRPTLDTGRLTPDTGRPTPGTRLPSQDTPLNSPGIADEAAEQPRVQQERATLRDILTLLKETYCHSVGVEYMHLQDPAERRWLQERMESTRNRTIPSPPQQLRILQKLTEASLFEQFLHSKYLGQKRFSLEGAESVLVLLDAVIDTAATHGCREIILGMAHRGRLNVQVNLLGKPLEAVFCEFEDSYDPDSLVGAGDVKYHKGYLGRVQTASDQEVLILLCDNPSHLESVNPVVEGVARARQDAHGEDSRSRVLPVLIHGDSAFAGQGVVAETLNFSQLEGYGTGGTIHIIINNQIGFTTLPQDARSTRYSTDVAKMLMIPIFHVHAEDPEAVAHVARLAGQYRRAFGKDVAIDLIGYRRYGHNEGDEPYYTQPRMVDRIRDRPLVYQLYADTLTAAGMIPVARLHGIRTEIMEKLDRAHRAAHERTCILPPAHDLEQWRGMSGEYSDEAVGTGVDDATITELARRLHQLPDGFSIHGKLQRILQRRMESLVTGQGIDWAGAEAMAFATLLAEGTSIRLSGEDSRRGTFSQRHSVLIDPSTEARFTPLQTVADSQARFQVYDSALSEFAVLGFEYGYSLMIPNALTIWEAQFGDFANGAQVIIDQYLVSGQAKWQRLSGLVVLLPHGFEGQGAEHSSARLERFLLLCAEDNIQVVYPSTPAQYFHVLRRQMRRSFRKPLVIMTPKSLLRHPMAVSQRAELAGGRFLEVIDDPTSPKPERRLLLCSGKIYYDLAAERDHRKIDDVALVRIEQLYPVPRRQLQEVLTRFDRTQEWWWVQEEPANMGAWPFMRMRWQEISEHPLEYVGRPEAASPATGFHQLHQQEQAAILDRALK